MMSIDDCETLSDRMPAVAAGDESWTERERDHLERCAGCRAEWALVRAAMALGEAPAAGLDPVRIGDGVVARLAAARAGEGAAERRAAVIGRRRIAGAGLAAAASIALALGLAHPRRAEGPRPTPVASIGDSSPAAGVDPESAGALVIPVPELESLDSRELQSVLETMDRPLGSGGSVDPGALNDLNDRELERVLGSWEG
jgi:hypothetical protein